MTENNIEETEVIQDFLEEQLEPNYQDLVERLDALSAACIQAKAKLVSDNDEILVSKILDEVHLKYSEMCSADWTVDTILHLLNTVSED